MAVVWDAFCLADMPWVWAAAWGCRCEELMDVWDRRGDAGSECLQGSRTSYRALQAVHRAGTVLSQGSLFDPLR